MLDVQERLAPIASGRLQEIVRAALEEPHAVLGAWDAVSLKEGPGALAARSIFRLQGVAHVGSNERPWSVILKVLTPAGGTDAPNHIDYWKREPLLYGAGVLTHLPAGLAAPRGYGYDEQADGSIWLWQEHVHDEAAGRWPAERWALAAQHLGRFNGAYLAGRPLPQAPWLGGQRLRTWVARHQPLVLRIAAAPADPAVRHWWPQPVVDAIVQLWEEQELFCAALERLPQTFGHGDAIRRNLFFRRGADGSEEMVGIDWEFAGYYAAGEEVGQMLSVAGAFYDVALDEVPALDKTLFAGYLAGLCDAGWRGDPRQVRLAYAAHAALRNAFNAVGTTVPDEAGRQRAVQTFGHTWEELAEARARLRPFLLALADEARTLMETL